MVKMSVVHGLRDGDGARRASADDAGFVALEQPQGCHCLGVVGTGGYLGVAGDRDSWPQRPYQGRGQAPRARRLRTVGSQVPSADVKSPFTPWVGGHSRSTEHAVAVGTGGARSAR